MRNPYGVSAQFDTTADVGIRCESKNLDQLFATAAWALFDLIADLTTIHPEKSFSIQLSSESLEELLVDWLNELLFVFETRKLLLLKFEVEIQDYCLKAQVYGTSCKQGGTAIKTHVKAVTYHNLELNSRDIPVSTRFIVDI